MENEVVLLQVVAVLEHDPIGLAIVFLVGDAGQGEGQFLGVIHFALVLLEGSKDVLGPDWEEKALGAYLVEGAGDGGQELLELGIFLLELLEILSILDQPFVHLDEVVVDFDLLHELLPEAGHHTQGLQVELKPLVGELLLDSVFELPEVLYSYAERLVHALLQDQLYQRIVVSLKAHQSLSDLVAVEHKLKVQEVLQPLHCVVPHPLVRK